MARGPAGRRLRWLFAAVTAALTGAGVLVSSPVVVAQAATVPPLSSWPMAGHDTSGTRNNPAETWTGTANVGRMTQQWSRTATGTLASTPAVVGGVVYASAASTLYALDALTGSARWTASIVSLTGVANDSVRGTPAVVGGQLYVGTYHAGAGARVLALRTSDGGKVWSSVVDPDPHARITGSVTVSGTTAYVGVSSVDETGSTCCTFRGSVVAVDTTTGAVKWRRYTVPVGYTGGAVWSSGPAVDAAAGLVYVTTGNNYSVPAGVCLYPTQTGCSAPSAQDYDDAVLALRVADGTVAWSLRTLSSDVWSTTCHGGPTCGPDFDFGAGPNLFTATVGGVSRKLVGAGQKSGIYWALDAATGGVVWRTRVGPGGTIGGIQWGTATDGRRIYVAETNTDRTAYSLTPSGATTTGGSFAALDPATGRILWQTADPQQARDFAYVSVANGVVYGGSDAVSGADMYALDAATGKILWSYAAGGSVMAGAAIVNGEVYWPSGYYAKTCPAGATSCTTSNVLRAFAPPRPNLVVDSVSWTPAAPLSGQGVTFRATVRNAGSAATLAGTAIGVLFKVDGASVSWSDTTTSALAPGASVTVTASGGPTGSATWTAGSNGGHAVVAQVDDVDRVPETNESDNTRSAMLYVGRPNLVVDAVGWSPSPVSAGQAVTFRATVRNSGTAPTPAGVIIGVLFKVDGASVWSANRTASLAPGTSAVLYASGGPTGSSTWTARAGTHSVLADVDDVNRIAESNESDNTRAAPLAVP